MDSIHIQFCAKPLLFYCKKVTGSIRYRAAADIFKN